MRHHWVSELAPQLSDSVHLTCECQVPTNAAHNLFLQVYRMKTKIYNLKQKGLEPKTISLGKLVMGQLKIKFHRNM